MLNDLKNKLKRKQVLKKIAYNIGDVVLEDDKIVCYVDESLLRKNKTYDISLLWLDNKLYYSKRQLNYLGLDKPVYVVFDGIEFDKPINLSSYGVFVIFRNCVFNDEIYIYLAEDVTFENNIYINKCGVYNHNKTFFENCHRIGHLKFIDDNLVNSSELISKLDKPNFGTYLSADKLEIINTKIGTSDNADFCVRARELVIENSVIDARNVIIDTDSMISDVNSNISASRGIMIDVTDNNKNNCNINSSYLVSNGLELINNSVNVNINGRELGLFQERLNLINCLKELRNKVDSSKQHKIDEVRRNLDNKNIRKILKK